MIGDPRTVCGLRMLEVVGLSREKLRVENALLFRMLVRSIMLGYMDEVVTHPCITP